MNSIFVFCAGTTKARENYRKTILNPIPDELVLSNTPRDTHLAVQSWREKAGGFYAWGVRGDRQRLTMLQRLGAGDCVLGFFDFHYRAIARLVGRLQNERLAEVLWGAPKGGASWDSIIFLTKPREIAVPASVLQTYLCKSYRGATRIGSERVQSIIKDFGDIETFVTTHFGQL